MKIVLTLLGIALVAFGLLTILLPIPTGILSLLAGIAMLAAVSPTFRRFFKWLRRRIRPLNRVMDSVEDKLPDRIAKPLHETDPDNEDDDEDDKDQDKAAACPIKAPASSAQSVLPRRPTAYRGRMFSPSGYGRR